ncbi:MAG: sugar-binding transcriptional regulator [Bryobacteraceae bacterium]|nr:sugar-binding transcriptional regulator [Bryobacteraceae bacterium]
MLRSLDHRRLLVKAARLYHEDGLNQNQIGERLGLSRQKVQRLLSEAHDEGVVQTTVKPIIGVFSDLEQGLERRFGLAEAVVVETTTSSDFESQATIAREVGAGAADYLVRVIRPHDKVVVSVGNAMMGMVNALSYSSHLDAADLKIIQGLGGLGDPRRETHATQVVTRLALALKAEPMLLGAPAVASTRELRDSFLRDPHISRTLDMARTAEMIFVGIGPTRSDSVVVQDFWKVMQPSAMDDLRARGAAGSINLRLFGADGKPFASEFDKRIIGLTLDEIKRIRRVVGVAGGFSKREAVKAALRGKLINVLVTDHITAQYLLRP